MVTTVNNNNVTAGELSSLDERFTTVAYLLPIAIIISIFCIVANLILIRYNKKRLSFLTFLLSIIIFVGVNAVFFYAMSQLADATVGNLFGTGDLEISIPGENMYQTLFSSWGPDIGFYLLLGSSIVLIIGFYLKRTKLSRLSK